jgi:hypothetical protein
MSLGMNAGKLLQLLRSEDYNAQRPNAWYSAAAIHDISVGTKEGKWPVLFTGAEG